MTNNVSDNTQQIASRAYNDYAQICSDKIDRKSWGKTVLTFNWSDGKITGVELQDTTTIKPPSNGGKHSGA
tara:strand:+ start:154 stop:366 length:213 start_codon:yes stop_codon:yes gene_type:complete